MLMRGDARSLPLADRCIQCVVTSPPYWGLRDYGTAGQIGLEPTPEAYVASLLTVFAEVWRVLRKDGTLWLVIGDSYANGCVGRNDMDDATLARRASQFGTGRGPGAGPRGPAQPRQCADLKPKDLVGIPWRVAFALQAAGWYLRSDIIWSKPNPMPESVTDRPTKAHEYLFLLSKSERYYYDAAAIYEAHVTGDRPDKWEARTYAGKGPADGNPQKRNGNAAAYTMNPLGRNKRSVWTIPTMPYSGAHFATFPEALVEPCMLAGCPIGGLVLDPFIGSGTVGAVAERLGRRWIGVDLAYQDLAAERTAQRGIPF